MMEKTGAVRKNAPDSDFNEGKRKKNGGQI